MDLSELKNIDLNDIISKLKKSEIFKDKKTLTKIGIFFGAFILSIIIYYNMVTPTLKDQRNQIAVMENNIIEIDNLNMEIENTIFQNSELEPKFFKNSVLFHSKEEVEDLYQSISNFALANGLSIVNIKKGAPKGVGGELPMMDDGAGMIDDGSGMIDDGSGMMDDGSGMMDDGSGMMDDGSGMMDDGSGEGGNILYYQIPVDYEIMGSFLGYLKFRRELSKSLKVINFDKEEIVSLKQPQGQIIAKGTISIVGLPNEYK